MGDNGDEGKLLKVVGVEGSGGSCVGFRPEILHWMWKKTREIEEKRWRVRVVKLGGGRGKWEKRVWEKKREKILDRILRGRETFSPIGEEMCEGEEGMGKTWGKFPSDSVT